MLYRELVSAGLRTIDVMRDPQAGIHDHFPPSDRRGATACSGSGRQVARPAVGKEKTAHFVPRSRSEMSKPRRKDAPAAPPRHHVSSAWMWIAVVAVVGLATMRELRPSIPAPGSESTAAAPPPTFLPTVENKTPPSAVAPAGMVWIPGGEFSMGAQDPPDMNDIVGMQATTDSRPIHRVYVDGFWMDATEVTNEQFAAFVKATGYVTVAERTPRAEDFPARRLRSSSPAPCLLAAGSCRATERPLPVVGVRRKARTGGIRSGQTVRSTGRERIRSCMSPTRTRKRTRNGRASVCRPKRSGSLPRAAA